MGPCIVEKVVSGGQSGADRAALDAALAAGLPCGGWCPRGRHAEDGRIADRYPLAETPSEDTAQRTEWNVRDSDGTLVLNEGELSGGTALTVRFAQSLGKPYLVVDPADPGGVGRARSWIHGNGIRILNVAGPRESKRPGIGADALAFLRSLLQTPAAGMRTPVFDSLQVDEISIDGICGRIAVSSCPGMIQWTGFSGFPKRDLAADIETVSAWGASIWVNLLTAEEMEFLGVAGMRGAVGNSGKGIRYYNLPIVDNDIPDRDFERSWASAGKEIREALRNGGKVFIHCRGGLGRSGTVAARLLIELGMEHGKAIRRVREARPGAVENPLQESYVRSIRASKR